MTALRFLTAAFFVWPALAHAEAIYLSGTIGPSPVFFMLEREGTHGLSGWYMYLRHGKEIQISGSVDAHDHFKLTAPMTPADMSEVMEGEIHDGKWSGNWTRPRISLAMPVKLTQNLDTLAGVSGHFACTARQVDGELGWTFEEKLDLGLAHGRVTKFSVGHTARTLDGDEQECHLDLGDLGPMLSRTGVRMRARSDTAGADGNHCTVQVIGMPGYLYLRMGDSAEPGNDCRGAGDSDLFCTPRGNWNDLILDRKTNTCTMVR